MFKKKLRSKAVHKSRQTSVVKRSWFRRHPLRTIALVIALGALLYAGLNSAKQSTYQDFSLGEEVSINAVSGREQKIANNKAEKAAKEAAVQQQRAKNAAKETAKREAKKGGITPGDDCSKGLFASALTIDLQINDQGGLGCQCTKVFSCKRKPGLSGLQIGYFGGWTGTYELVKDCSSPSDYSCVGGTSCLSSCGK